MGGIDFFGIKIGDDERDGREPVAKQYKYEMSYEQLAEELGLKGKIASITVNPTVKKVDIVTIEKDR